MEDPLGIETRIRRKMKMWVLAEIRRVIIYITLEIKIMVNNEEEEEEDLDKDLGEVVSKETIFSVEKKGIEPMNVR